MTAPVDVETLASILRDAAETEILPHFRALKPGDIREKSSAMDLVTAADEAAERFIKSRCAEHFPGALFVGEESVAAEPALLGRLGDADLAIVVDPIDGTANFAAGLPAFGVMAAVVARNETVAGILYDPFGRDFILAERGAGAVLDRRGERASLRVAGAAPLAESVGSGSPSYLAEEHRAGVFANLAKVGMVANYRCALEEYWAMASGHLHFLFFGGLMPWDNLAGTLIVEEAGGFVRRLDGGRYRPSDIEGGLLAATSREDWQRLHAALFADALGAATAA